MEPESHGKKGVHAQNKFETIWDELIAKSTRFKHRMDADIFLPTSSSTNLPFFTFPVNSSSAIERDLRNKQRVLLFND